MVLIIDNSDCGDNNGSRNTEDGKYYSEVPRALNDCAGDLQQLVKACPFFGEDEELSRGVLEGDTGATLGLLLNVLPNLRTLRITDYIKRSPGADLLKRVLDRMLVASHNPLRGSILALDKLERVIFTGRCWSLHSDDCYQSTYAPLLYFPSVRDFWVENLHAREYSWTYPGVQSHISRMNHYLSTVDIKNLKLFLKTTQNLLHFIYWEMFQFQLPDLPGFHVQQVAQTLLEQVGHSLRHLDIEYGRNKIQLARAGAFFIGSLKAFRVLETIRINGSLLVEPVETQDRIYSDPATARSGQTRRLTDFLPPSVVHIKFTAEQCVTGYGIGGDVAAMLQGLPEEKVNLFPHLEAVVFTLDEPWDTTAAQSVVLRACNEVGIKILTDVTLTGGEISIRFR